MGFHVPSSTSRKAGRQKPEWHRDRRTACCCGYFWTAAAPGSPASDGIAQAGVQVGLEASSCLPEVHEDRGDDYEWDFPGLGPFDSDSDSRCTVQGAATLATVNFNLGLLVSRCKLLLTAVVGRSCELDARVRRAFASGKGDHGAQNL